MLKLTVHTLIATSVLMLSAGAFAQELDQEAGKTQAERDIQIKNQENLLHGVPSAVKGAKATATGLDFTTMRPANTDVVKAASALPVAPSLTAIPLYATMAKTEAGRKVLGQVSADPRRIGAAQKLMENVSSEKTKDGVVRGVISETLHLISEVNSDAVVTLAAQANSAVLEFDPEALGVFAKIELATDKLIAADIAAHSQVDLVKETHNGALNVQAELGKPADWVTSLEARDPKTGEQCIL